MPELSRFHGIRITMYHREHGVPHFHVRYGKHKAAIALDGTVLIGGLGTSEMKLVRQWIALHAAELAANWKLAKEGKELSTISPLA